MARIIPGLIFVSLFLAGSATPAAANQDVPSSFTGGPISGSMVMQPKGSPYEITSPIDIPEGAALTINPGVEINGKGSVIFRVQGTLISSGSDTQPVIIKVSNSLIQTIETSSRGDAQRVDFAFTHITGGRSFEISTRAFGLTDSEIVDQKTCQPAANNSIKITTASASFARNYFRSICGFYFDVNFGVFGPRGTFTVANNHFDGSSLGSSLLSVTALRKDTLTLKENTFSKQTNKIIASGFFSTNVYADGNYWGGLSLDAARKLIDSSTPDTFNPALVTLTSQLLAASTQTPTAQRYNLTPTPTPSPVSSETNTPSNKPVKYANCSALNKVYSGGVAKSATSKNKGGKIKLKPTVNAKVYDLNKSLDRDKDGLACER
jgi:hypothetical protein